MEMDWNESRSAVTPLLETLDFQEAAVVDWDSFFPVCESVKNADRLGKQCGN